LGGIYISILTIFNHPKEILIEKNITKVRVVSRECREDKMEPIVVDREPTFRDILDKNITRAVELYISIDDSSIRDDYGDILEDYFINAPKSRRLLNLLKELIDRDLDSNRFMLTLAKVYIDMDRFDEAIEILFDLQGDLDIDGYLSSIVDRYIKRLMEQGKYSKLLPLLEDIVNRDIDTQRYTIELSKVYFKLKNYEKAKEVLSDNIDEDSIYYSRAINLLKKIEESPDNRYSYQIPLIKIGNNQYGVNARIDDIPIKLLIDTGATLTLVDSSFIALNNISKDIVLNTAGGAIMANSAFVDLEVDSIRFQNFKITTTPFSQRGIDGLLGMDFFMRFDFKIDQERSYLYLKEKL